MIHRPLSGFWRREIPAGALMGMLALAVLPLLAALPFAAFAQDAEEAADAALPPSAHQEHKNLFGPDAPPPSKAPAERAPSVATVSTHSANRMKEANRVFFGYHPTWVDGEEARYRYDLISHMAYFDVSINNDGSISDSSGWKTRSAFLNIKNYCQQFNVTLVLCATKFGNSDIDTFLASPAARTAACANLLAQVQAAGIDGINIDFEFVNSGSAALFTAFMQELATTFHTANPDYHVSIAAGALPSAGLQEKELSQIIDALFMMNYNFYYSGGNPGPCSTLETSSLWGSGSVLDTIRDHTRDGVALNKLIAGLAWYGDEWPCDSPNPGATQTGNGTSILYNTCLTTNWPTYGKIWNWPADGPYYSRDMGGGAYRQGWCDDHVAWRRRCEMVKRTGISGIGCWALGYASTSTTMYPRLWQAIQETFLDGPDYIIDDFELWDDHWQDPNYSGQTVGDTDNDSTFVQSSAQTQGVGSKYSGRLYYDFESSTGFIREYYSSGSLEEGRAVINARDTLSVWIYGDASNNQFRFCVRDASGQLEVSNYTTVNWTGWQKVSWNLATDTITGYLGGNGAIDGGEARVDSFQWNKPSGGAATGTVYFDNFAYTPGEDKVTVGASGADYTDIQTAIDSFTTSNERPNVVELKDATYTLASQLILRKASGAVYDTLIVRAASGVNPLLICAQNGGDCAIFAQADADVEFGSDSQTITIIPSAASGPGDNNTVAFRADEAAEKINIKLTNVLIAPNNGSNAASTDGTTAPGAGDTKFGGGFQLYSGPGGYQNNAWLKNVTVTGTGNGTGLNLDGFEFYGDGDFGGWMLEGCRSSYNAGNGVFCDTKYTEFLGSRLEPILIHNNSKDGIRLSAESVVHRIYNTAVVANSAKGLYASSTSGYSDFVAKRCVFAQNTSNNVQFDDASALAVTFEECTFHDASGSSDDIYLSSAADSVAAVLSGCIISGNGGTSPSDTINISTSSTGTVNITNSALVLNGPDSLLLTYNGLYGNTGNVTQTNVINSDPQYVSESFNAGANPNYLKVSNAAYKAAGPGGAPIRGWGDFKPITWVSSVLISEYVEGSGDNQSIELSNGTGGAVDLEADGYDLAIYMNGSPTVSYTYPLSGVLANGGTYVVTNRFATGNGTKKGVRTTSAALDTYADAETDSRVLRFDGDDVIALRKNGVNIDIFGRIGEQAVWGSGGTTSQNTTLRRKTTIGVGDTNGADAFDPAVEWVAFPQDTFSGLGSPSVPVELDWFMID